MPQPIVVVMVKAPRAGSVKTRLVPPLSESAAASLAACFAQDTILNARRVLPNVLVAYAPADAQLELELLLPGDLLWFEQVGNDLGQRLDSVVNHVSQLGFSPFILLGADSPTLPTAFLQQALQVLVSNQADISLGPTNDGGYYLIGLHRPVPDLFQNIDWSTSAVYKQTEANASALNLRLNATPCWYDVDTPADLERMRDQILSDHEMQQQAPNTYRWLTNRGLRHK